MRLNPLGDFMQVLTGAARLAAASSLGVALSASVACGAWALEEAKNEKEQLDACEHEICTLLVKKDPAGSNLQCNIQKTWAGSKIKQGVEEKKLTWSLGDMRCGVQLDVKRQDMVDALTKPEYELKLAPHAVKCDVEREKEVINVSVTIAPRIQFKDGKAVKAWMGVGEITAPTVVKGAIWTAAQLEDTFGVVHGDLIKEINRFVYERCPKRLSQ
jgi:hypothetical protein